jgi:hypothetical protein
LVLSGVLLTLVPMAPMTAVKASGGAWAWIVLGAVLGNILGVLVGVLVT